MCRQQRVRTLSCLAVLFSTGGQVSCSEAACLDTAAVMPCALKACALWQVNTACQQAMRCWWEDGHPGWMIFTLGNQHFERLDDIIAVRSAGVSQLSGIGGAIREGQARSPAGIPNQCIRMHGCCQHLSNTVSRRAL